MAHFDLPLSELYDYAPDVREPSDFDEFWSATLAEARQFPTELVFGETVTFGYVQVTDVTFPGWGGDPIKAWYARPIMAVPGANLPLLVQYNGYGGGRGLPNEHVFWAQAGFAHFFMDVRGQGSSWGNGGDTPDPSGSAPSHPGFMTRGINSPHDYYYRRVFTDAVRAVDAARTLPEVDAGKTFICGGSQGGGIAIAVSGLVPDLAGVMPDVAFLCHYERAISITDSDPYGEIKRYLSIHRGVEEDALTTLSYFDGVNFAKRATAPALWSAALMDAVCPPSTTFAAFNRYGEKADSEVTKSIEVYPYNGHEGGQGHQQLKQWEFLNNLR